MQCVDYDYPSSPRLRRGRRARTGLGANIEHEISLRTGDGTAGESLAIHFAHRGAEKGNRGSRFRLPGEGRRERGFLERSDWQGTERWQFRGSGITREAAHVGNPPVAGRVRSKKREAARELWKIAPKAFGAVMADRLPSLSVRRDMPEACLP